MILIELTFVFLTKVNLLYLRDLITLRCCLVQLRLFPENCFKNSDLDDSGVFLHVSSDTNAWAFNWPGVTQAVALDVTRAFDRFWHADFPHNSWLSIWPYFFISQLYSYRTCSQEYLVNVGVPEGCILFPTLSLLYIN